MILVDAKYSCAVIYFKLADVVLSIVAVILAIYTVNKAKSDWWQYILPILKGLKTCYDVWTLWAHRPNRKGKDMLYFAACDAGICVGENPPVLQ